MLGIFGSTERIRLITTNFDTHFTAALAVVFPNGQVPHYVGPALPPGERFRGIAHLHGSLAQSQDRLVLTDRDFAAAYMAEGWAARFLVHVFEAQTILFVGYSMSDPLMRYLMRALPVSRRSFALCHEEESTSWTQLNVTPITFASDADGDRYGELKDALERWHWYARAPVTDHDRELRRLVALGPPASPQDIDYIRSRLETQAGLRTFVQIATEEPWFQWVAGQRFLDPLVDESELGVEGQLWADWCLRHFCSGDNPVLLAFIRGRGVALNPQFAFLLVLYLTREPLPPRPILRQIVALLANQPSRHNLRLHHFDWLLKKLVEHGYGLEAVALVARMTFIHLEPLEGAYRALEDVSETEGLRPLTSRLGIEAPVDEVHRFLRAHGLALAALAPRELISLGVCRVGEAYSKLSLARGVDGGPIDWLAFRRTSIAPSDQDSYGHVEDVLVLLVRVVLDHWSEHDSASLLEFGERYSRDDRRLLGRLALYAFAECKAASADELLKRAKTESWATDFQLRPEFYRLLRAHYARASEATKEEVIVSMSDDASWGDFDEHDARSRFGIAQLLHSLDPESPATTAFAEAECSAHPTWEPGDPDGFLTRVEVGFGGGEPSPVGADEIVTWSPADAVDRLVAELNAASERGIEHSLLGAFQEAVKTTPAWGIEFLRAASRADQVPKAVTDAALWALRDVEVGLDGRVAFLEFASGWEWPDNVTAPLAQLLDRWSQTADVGGDHPYLTALESAADRVYERAQTLESGLLSESG